MVTTLLVLLIINCINSQFNTTNGTNHNASTAMPTTSIPNVTETYTTSTPPDECDHHSNTIYTILPSQSIFESIIVRNSTIAIEIQFDVKLNHYCNVSSCTIFCLHNEYDIGSISLSINGVRNYFLISIKNEFNYTDDYKIPNADILLPVDNDYHTIYMSYQYGLDHLMCNENIFQIDNIEYNYLSTASVLSLDTTYKLYMSCPSENVIKGSVSNICIKSSLDEEGDNGPCPQCISEIKCGQTITGELTFKAEWSYLYFNLSKPASAIFDSCGSSFDTFLSLYTIDGQMIQSGDDDGFCADSNREQLATPALDAGDYVVGISGWNSWDLWSITALCYYNDELDHTNDPYWTALSCCGHISIGDHAIFASWNGILYVVDEYKVQYSPMRLFDNNYVWSYIGYNEEAVEWDTVPDYAQYQSSMYIYVYRNDGNDILIHLNLLDLSDVVFESVPSNASWTGAYPDKFCVVASADSVYIIRAAVIIVYNAHARKLRAVKTGADSDAIFGCTMDRDYKLIYIVAPWYGPITFDTVTEEPGLILLNGSPIKGEVWSERSSLITGWNNKIYLHRCVLLQCDEIIVSLPSGTIVPITSENQIVSHASIATITTESTNIISKTSQLILFDDNIILLKSTDYRDAISLHFMVTNVVSINFTNTISSELIWPSDGFTIKYCINDFSNSSVGVHSIWFRSNASNNININASITLNSSRDNCICRHYNCQNCTQHFDLAQYLMLTDNDVNELDFNLFGNNQSDMLILPDMIPIKLQRCSITVNISETTDTDITFHFGLSNNCHSRIGHNFSLNITSSSLDIANELIIDILTDTRKICRLCEIKASNDCVHCDDKQNTFTIHQQIDSDTRFEFSLESNMIDLRVVPSTLSDKIVYSYAKDTVNNSFLYLLFLLLIPCIFIFIGYTYCNRQYMNAFIVKQSLVLIIGVSQFDDKTGFLPGVQQNVFDLISLWNGYNYDVFICNKTTLYCTKRDIMYFIDMHKEKLQSQKYRCAMIHLISHGAHDCLVSSDGKIISLDFFRHEMVESAQDANVVKIIFHHGCRGQNDYTIGNAVSPQIPTRSILSINRLINDNVTTTDVLSTDSNCITISGNISGRTMSDSGNFTKCICDSFRNNLKRIWKADFNALLVEIGRNLENETNRAELCNVNGTLRYYQIRFEKCEDVQKKEKIEMEMQQMSDIDHSPNVKKLATLEIYNIEPIIAKYTSISRSIQVTEHEIDVVLSEMEHLDEMNELE
eukprot:801173_1